jgi:hypothetical protein
MKNQKLLIALSAAALLGLSAYVWMDAAKSKAGKEPPAAEQAAEPAPAES